MPDIRKARVAPDGSFVFDYSIQGDELLVGVPNDSTAPYSHTGILSNRTFLDGFSETLNALDYTSISNISNQTIAETLSAVDTTGTPQILTLLIVESGNLLDTGTSFNSSVNTLTEGMNAVDSVAKSSIALNSISERNVISDNLSSVFLATGKQKDTMSAQDTTFIYLNTTSSINETCSASDSADQNTHKISSVSVLEIGNAVDSMSESNVSTKSTSENLSIVDTALYSTLQIYTVVVSEAGNAATSSLLLSSSQTYTAQTSNIPDVLYVIDANVPSTLSTLVPDVPEMQLDKSSNVLSIIDPINFVQINKGYGACSLRQNGAGNVPYFHGTTTSLNSAFDSFVFPSSAANILFASANNPWSVFMIIRQTGAGATNLMTSVSSNGTFNLYGSAGASDGALHIEQTNGSAIGDETSGSLTALNQWQIISILCDGNTFSIFRNGTQTLQTPTGAIGGLSNSTKFEFLNNPQADVAYIQVANSCPSISLHNTELSRLATIYGIAVSTVSIGSSTTLQLDTTQNWLTYPNFPASNTLATETTPTLHDGLTLAAGATSLAALNFLPGGTTDNRTKLDAQMYYNYLTGNQNTVIGTDGIDGNHGNGSAQYYAFIRRYASGSPYNLHTFSANGLSLNAVSSLNNTAAGIQPVGTSAPYTPNVYGGMIRLPTFILPGTTISITYKGPSSPRGWCPISLYHGGQLTPGAGGNPYTNYVANDSDFPNPIIVENTSNSVYFEYDLNSGYAQDAVGVPQGKQLDTTFVNTNSSSFNIQPYDVYVANGPNFQYLSSVSPTAVEILNTGINTGTSFNRLVMNWRGDGSNLVDMFLNGILFRTQYWEYEKAGTYVDNIGNTVQVPMHLVIANQAIPTFLQSSDLASMTPQDGGTIDQGPWSIVIQEIKIIKGNLTPASISAATLDSNAISGSGGARTLGEGTLIAASATISSGPTTGNTGAPITGYTATVSPTGATAYAVLSIGGANQGSRVAFTGNTVPPLTPAYDGTYTIKIYAAATGSTPLAITSTIAVSGTATVILTSGSSWTVPSGINNLVSIECWGGGGGGYETGGNGGDWAKITNLTVTSGASMTYSIGAAGNAGYNNAGGPTWFGSQTTVYADGGNGGLTGASPALNTTSESVGSTIFVGGQAGTVQNSSGSYCSGGGGAASPAGNGVASANSTGTAGLNYTAGGASGSGAAGGAAGPNTTSGSGGVGTNATEGGAGGGAGYNGGAGGFPGGGGGGGSNGGAQGAGGQIRIIY